MRRKGKEPNVLNPVFLIVRSNVNVELLGNSFPAGVRDSFSTAALLENLQHCCRQHNYSGQCTRVMFAGFKTKLMKLYQYEWIANIFNAKKLPLVFTETLSFGSTELPSF